MLEKLNTKIAKKKMLICNPNIDLEQQQIHNKICEQQYRMGTAQNNT